MEKNTGTIFRTSLILSSPWRCEFTQQKYIFRGVEKKERWIDVGKKEFGDHGTSVNRVTQRTQRKTAMFLLFMASR